MARLVVDSSYQDNVRSNGASALVGDLTVLERKRLAAIAFDRGLGATRMLYKGFRLSKLYATLPLTCALLGKRRLVREVNLFWAARPSISLYYFEEAFGFCDQLKKRLRTGLKVTYLDEVMAYECGCLELRRPRSNNEAPDPQVIEFQHDPDILLNCLVRGKRPRSVPLMKSTLVGDLNDDGEVQWHFITDGVKTRSARPRATRSDVNKPPNH